MYFSRGHPSANKGSTNGNNLLNTMNIGGFGTFEIELFVFIVMNKVMHIMNIFVDSKIVFTTPLKQF